jgi:hypothetical protein
MINKQSAAPPRKEGLLALGTRLSGGREIVIRQFMDVVALVLDRIAPFIDAQDYRLCGTIAALLQGVFLPTRDINFLVRTRAHVEIFSEALEDYPCPAPPTLQADGVRYSATHIIRGIDISIGWLSSETESDGIETFGRGPWEHYVSITCGQHTVPAVALELRLVTELFRERPDRYKPLLKHLKKHGCDVPILRRGMDARELPETQQREVLQLLGS